jgi:hypothetical protein
MTDPKDDLKDLFAVKIAHAALVLRLLLIHYFDADDGTCAGCDKPWPCPTILVVRKSRKTP